MRRRTNGTAALLGAAIALAAPSTGRADTIQDCDAAYRQTQISRRAGKLLDARKQAIVCGAAACPDADKTDCLKWLTEIEDSLPTVVIAVQDASGTDTLKVRVSDDGALLAETLDGKAAALDPGQHRLRFEIAGVDATERDVIVLEGTKNQRVEVSFKRKEAPPPLSPPPPPPWAPAISGGVPTWAWVSGGLGIVALGIGAGFGINALVASGTCPSKGCPGTADSVNQQRHLGLGMFIGLGTVGAAGVAAGIVGIASGKKEAPRPAAIRVLPMVGPGAGGAAVVGIF